MGNSEKIWGAVPGNEWREEHDLETQPTWGADMTHSLPRLMPMDSWFWMKHMVQGYNYANERICKPSIKGTLRRVRNGADFATFCTIKDEEELKKRESKFSDNILTLSENFPQWWENSKKEMMEDYRNLRSFDLDNASNIELLDHLYDLQDVARRMWKIHFLGLVTSINAWVLLENMCKELWGFTDLSHDFQKITSGYDNKMLQVDKRLWGLSRSAIENRISDTIMESKPTELYQNLEQSDSGRNWLKDFENFLDEDGHRAPHLHVMHEKTWFEDPTPAIEILKGFIKKNDMQFAVDIERERMAREREETIANFLPKVPEHRKDEFMKLLSAAQLAGMYNEEHTYYCENYCNAMIRRSLLGIGRRLVKEEVIELQEDIMMLSPPEIEGIIGGPEGANYSEIVKQRRKEWEGWHKEDIPPFLTKRSSPEEAFGKDIIYWKEPIFDKIVGGPIIQPEIKPELKADFFGLSVSRGIVEGTARVVTAAEQLSEIQEGEILVAPFTTTSWTPVFSMIKGVVTDVGGALSHTAIVSREHGIPAVTNTLEGTKKIKTGQRIRINGDEGAIFILG